MLYPYLHSISACADYIVDRLDESSIQILKGMKQDELVRLHHGWGMSIRKEFGLWQPDNPITKKWHANEPGHRVLKNDVDHSPDHPDAVSHQIMIGVWKKITA